MLCFLCSTGYSKTWTAPSAIIFFFIGVRRPDIKKLPKEREREEKGEGQIANAIIFTTPPTSSSSSILRHPPPAGGAFTKSPATRLLLHDGDSPLHDGDSLPHSFWTTLFFSP